MSKKFDFAGWATRNNVKCSDGRVILKDAFRHNNGQKVPLVWNHQHNDPQNILGHAILENREEGVYAYCTFNDSESGKNAKLLVEHGDIVALSIYANQLKQQGPSVLHGSIREVSLVTAGANPEAFIETVINHGEESDDEVIIYFSGDDIPLQHSDDESENKNEKGEIKNMKIEQKTDELKREDKKEKTIGEVFDTFTEEQKTVVYALIGQALESEGTNNEEENEGGQENMKHNVFEGQKEEKENVLQHSDIEAIFSDAKRYGSLKESALEHGIEDIDYLFPDAKNITDSPIFIKRDTGWVAKVFGTTHKTPFSKIKSLFADITEEDARAKGYIKGEFKKEEVFKLLKRTTDSTTIYKKQKMEKDDLIDINDFDVVAWIKAEMRMMLDEEIARAVLVGDGRSEASDDKIDEGKIRPIWKDADLYTIKSRVSVPEDATSDDKAKAFIKSAIKSRKSYKGSGDPILFTTEDVLTDCLLLEDKTGRVIYESVERLATALRVKEIVTVPVMENLTREVQGVEHELMGIIVNLADYNIGADKGGAVNMFEDFDIDYNAQKYLIETRCSGALIKPYSAIVLEAVVEDEELAG
ncbi:MAG: phage major capsid protein [Clostridiaceae bacterium]|nr:phage major capsid protein [Clostridiaceae bacterium]